MSTYLVRVTPTKKAFNLLENIMPMKSTDLPEVLPTSKACIAINRSPQTLRKWACLDCAPMGIRPIRINGRLAWRVSDLQKLLGGE
jgi:hypothetical protein